MLVEPVLSFVSHIYSKSRRRQQILPGSAFRGSITPKPFHMAIPLIVLQLKWFCKTIAQLFCGNRLL